MKRGDMRSLAGIVLVLIILAIVLGVMLYSFLIPASGQAKNQIEQVAPDSEVSKDIDVVSAVGGKQKSTIIDEFKSFLREPKNRPCYLRRSITSLPKDTYLSLFVAEGKLTMELGSTKSKNKGQFETISRGTTPMQLCIIGGKDDTKFYNEPRAFFIETLKQAMKDNSRTDLPPLENYFGRTDADGLIIQQHHADKNQVYSFLSPITDADASLTVDDHPPYAIMETQVDFFQRENDVGLLDKFGDTFFSLLSRDVTSGANTERQYYAFYPPEDDGKIFRGETTEKDRQNRVCFIASIIPEFIIPETRPFLPSQNIDHLSCEDQPEINNGLNTDCADWVEVWPACQFD